MNTEIVETSAFVAFVMMALRLSTPLTLAALGGYCSERSGTINIALEGLMLIGAFAAAVVAHGSQSALWGVAAGIGAATVFAGLHAFLCINLRANQIISGIAVNLMAAGIPPVVSKALYDMSGGTPLLESASRVEPVFGLSPFVLAAFAAAALLWFLQRATSFGQYLRFAGEHPQALATQGVSVVRVRWVGVLLSGVFCGLAGAYLSIDHSGGFSRNMTAGRGFIAVAALVIGRWHPAGALAATLLFGAIEASQILLQGFSLPGGAPVPVQWIQLIPYVATLVILAGVVGGRWGRSRPPSALGQPIL